MMSDSYALYLDDVRYPPQTGEDWVLCRSLEAMRDSLELRGLPTVISFDYELGRTDPTHDGYDAVCSFLDYLLTNPPEEAVELEVRLHTSSGYGKARMAQLLEARTAECRHAHVRLVRAY